MQFFQFCNFFFSTLDPFSEKTYEKTSHFYNIFPNSISNCTHSRSFTLWIFFSKILWPFQFNDHFFSFPSLLREKFWKELTISWLIYKVPILMCTLANFCPVEIFKKIWQPFQNLLNYFLTSFPKNLMKKPLVYLTDTKRSHKVLLCCKNFKSRNFWQASGDGL